VKLLKEHGVIEFRHSNKHGQAANGMVKIRRHLQSTSLQQMEARNGKKSGQAAVQIAGWLAAAWSGLAYDTLARVCFCLGRARPCQGAANVASEMTSFSSRWRMRARPAGGVSEDATARVMTAGLAFPIVYPLLAALQACIDINVSTTLRYDNENHNSSVECACNASQTQSPACPEKPH